MPRQCSEAAVLAVGNRYDLVLIASARVRELVAGAKPKLQTNNMYNVTALKEIEEGLIGREYLKKIKDEPKKDRKYDKYDKYDSRY
jgi:DNA-directed RNA polymerase omega subunit